MLVPEEEHDGHRVVKLVHLLKIRDLVNVAEIDDGKVFHAIGDFVEDFILGHAYEYEVSM